jgi:hypothetical protein
MTCALRFFCGITLGQKGAFERIMIGASVGSRSRRRRSFPESGPEATLSCRLGDGYGGLACWQGGTLESRVDQEPAHAGSYREWPGGRDRYAML